MTLATLLAAGLGHGNADLLIFIIAILFLLGALYVGVQLGQWFGAVVLVVCALLIFLLA